MISLRNVLRAPARSIMTAVGVAAGLALFVAITALTVDVGQQLEGAVNAYQMEVAVYERRATSPFSSRISPTQMEELQTRYGVLLSPLVVGTHNEKWSAYALVMGVPSDLLNRIPLTAGARYEEGSGEVVLGEIAAHKLGVQQGQQLSLDGREVRVSGIFRTGSRLLDGGLMTDIPHAQQILTREGAERQYTLAVLRAESKEAAGVLIDEINRRYPSLKAIPGTEFAGAHRALRVVDAFVRTISAVALVGTCLVVTNTFLMAIAQRTREIGILMAVGWTPWLVLRMLFAESLVLCITGAALGNLLALILLRVVNRMDSIGFGWIPVRFPLALTGTSLVVALAVAMIALAWPAVVLYRMQPLSALRHE